MTTNASGMPCRRCGGDVTRCGCFGARFGLPLQRCTSPCKWPRCSCPVDLVYTERYKEGGLKR
jgi:hypothetical protein